MYFKPKSKNLPNKVYSFRVVKPIEVPHAEPSGICTIFHVLYVMRSVKENTFFILFGAIAIYSFYLFRSKYR